MNGIIARRNVSITSILIDGDPNSTLQEISTFNMLCNPAKLPFVKSN